MVQEMCENGAKTSIGVKRPRRLRRRGRWAAKLPVVGTFVGTNGKDLVAYLAAEAGERCNSAPSAAGSRVWGASMDRRDRPQGCQECHAVSLATLASLADIARRQQVGLDPGLLNGSLAAT